MASSRIRISGVLVFSDRTPINGARVKIWETDSLQRNNDDDVIVDVTTDSRGRFDGEALWRDSGNLLEIGTYKYEVSFQGKFKTGNNITNPHTFFKTLKTPWMSPRQEREIEDAKSITITGNLIYTDKSPISGARVKIWETDSLQRNNPDDLIVDDVTDNSGRFSGRGLWKDGGTAGEIGTYRWEVTADGFKTTGSNITNPHTFFKTLNSKIPSADERSITIQGKALYEDKSPIAGAQVKIWETDSLQANNSDDIIVDMVTDSSGTFFGTGVWKDSGNAHEIATYRYEVKHEGKTKTGGNITNPQKFFEELTLPWEKLERWQNWIHDFKTDVMIRYPKSLGDLKSLLEEAVDNDLKIKPVGSGHSHSNVAAPEANQLLVNFKNLTGSMRDYRWLKPSIRRQRKYFQRVKAGTQIRQMNIEILAPKELALINQGPYDGQTLAGAINTNTHGTGIEMGGFSDMVQSVQMLVVVPGVDGTKKVEDWIIEPTEGISDPNLFRRYAPNKHLVQNDDVFYSAVCGYGMFGIAYSYTLKVRDLYWLNERYEHTNWETVKEKFNPSEILRTISEHDQVKLYVHTSDWLKNGERSDLDCRIDTWNETPLPLPEKPMEWDSPEKVHKVFPPMRPRTDQDFWKNVIGTSFKIKGKKNDGRAADSVINTVKNSFFAVSDRGPKNKGLFYRQDDVLNSVAFDMRDDYRSASACYRVIRRVRDNDIDFHESLRANKIDNTIITKEATPEDFGPSMEICVELDSTLVAIEKTLNFLSTKKVNFSIPTGVRFVKESEHFLSPAYHRNCAFIEVVGWLPDWKGKETKDWDEYRNIYSEALDELCDHLRGEIPGVRFHLGKNNHYDFQSLREDFPGYETWVKNFHLFNASGVFDCPASRRWNLERDNPGFSNDEISNQLNSFKS